MNPHENPDDGEFAFDPGRLKVQFFVDGELGAEDEFVYAFSDDPDRGALFHYKIPRSFEAGKHSFSIRTQPLVDKTEKLHRLDFRVDSITVKGPADQAHWTTPEGYDRFFQNGRAPDSVDDRQRYAFDVLERFSRRAFRGPV